MSNMQVKNVPDELHAAARERAATQGMSLSDYVLSLVRRDLALPGRHEWFERVAARDPVRGIDSVAAVREAREARDEQLVAKPRRR